MKSKRMRALVAVLITFLAALCVLGSCANPVNVDGGPGGSGSGAEDAADGGDEDGGDEDAGDTGFGATGFEVTVSEGVENGTVLGTVAVSGHSGTPDFEMTFSTPVSAMAIDGQGEVTVLDRGKFDYEQNPLLEAAIRVTADGESARTNITVNLQDSILDGDQGLLAYYPFDDGEYTDLSFNGYDVNPVGEVISTSERDGTEGNALDFSSGHLTVVDLAQDLTTDGSSFTVSAWVRDDGRSDGWRTIVAKQRSNGLQEFVFRLRKLGSESYEDGSLAASFMNKTDEFRDSGNTFPEDSWTHVAMVYDGGTGRLFKDGSRVAGKESVGLSGGGDVTIGGRLETMSGGSIQNFSGSIDDVAFFSQALTAEQITTLMDSDGTVGISAAETDLRVTYDSNGGDGQVPVDGSTYTAGDSVTVFGNVNELTLVGYTFGGWNTKPDANGDDYTQDDTFNITDDVTLYAVWEFQEPEDGGGGTKFQPYF